MLVGRRMAPICMAVVRCAGASKWSLGGRVLICFVGIILGLSSWWLVDR